MQPKKNYILHTLVFDEDLFALKQTASWLKTAGHQTELCSNYTEFVDKITDENIHYDVVLFDFNNSNKDEFDSIHAVKLSHFYNAGRENKTKFILYTNNKSEAAHHLDEIKDAQISTIIYKSLKSDYFFEKIAATLGMSPVIARGWEINLNGETRPTAKILQFKPIK